MINIHRPKKREMKMVSWKAPFDLSRNVGIILG